MALAGSGYTTKADFYGRGAGNRTDCGANHGMGDFQRMLCSKKRLRLQTAAGIAGPLLCGTFLFAAPTLVLTPVRAVGQENAAVLAPLDAPFLFTYGTWEKRARIENGKIVLRGEGITPRGGGGCNAALDLSASGGDCPALRVKVANGSKMRVIRLVLRDADGHSGAWEFTLPAPGGGLSVVTPKEGASLKQPNALDKPGQNVDLKHIMQWQLSGDWSSDLPIDIEISGLLILKPDAAALAARQEKTRREAAEQEQQRQEQAALKAKYLPGQPGSPAVVETYLVAPDILALTMDAGHVVPGKLGPYVPQAGDEKHPKDKSVYLARGGEEIGWLIGPKRDTLVTYEKLEGDPLLEFLADSPDTFTIASQDDAAFAAGLRPPAVYRKSKPTDWAQPSRGFAMRHIVYLKLPQPAAPGKTYRITLSGLNTQKSEIVFKCDPSAVRSEAVHVPQIGFRPDDPVKRAFLSIWLGTGGAYSYPDPLAFSLVDTRTGKSVYTGKVVAAKRADEPETMWKSQNFNLTSVYRMDFGDFKTPGNYRVSVAGIGCSYAFDIQPDVWTKAFQIQMQGLYNERSGVAGGPPYSQYKHPADMRPDTGTKATYSTYSVLTNGNEAFSDIAKGDTGVPAPEAWGGYHDAGDWNPRRVTHMKVTLAQLELLELFPEKFGRLKLSLPANPKLPDILTEALFELDCFHRLQKPDGGVPYGIETEGDPIDGEVSWLQSMPVYVLAPDIWNTYYYAGVAARFARLVRPYDAALAKTYAASARKAMQWSEADYIRRRAAGTLDKLRWEAKDARNYAALQCWLLTQDKHWHDVFLENTCLNDPNKPVFAWGDHVQRDAAFTYALLDDKQADPAIKANARAAVLSEAEKSLVYAAGNAFNLTTPDRGKPMFIGFYSAPDAVELARAHYLTQDAKYLAGAVQACQFGLGANPGNLVYTTGLGSNPYKHPLHLDSRRSGQPAPAGLTPYANVDFSQWHDNFTTWPITYHLNALCTPKPFDWPATEAFFDIFLYPAMTEFVVDNWSPNVFVWGYLAARK